MSIRLVPYVRPQRAEDEHAGLVLHDSTGEASSCVGRLMATHEVPFKMGQTREDLEEFVEAMHAAQDAVRHLGSLLDEQLDRQVFDTISLLITHTASAIWDTHPHAEQFVEGYVHGGSE